MSCLPAGRDGVTTDELSEDTLRGGGDEYILFLKSRGCACGDAAL